MEDSDADLESNPTTGEVDSKKAVYDHSGALENKGYEFGSDPCDQKIFFLSGDRIGQRGVAFT